MARVSTDESRYFVPMSIQDAGVYSGMLMVGGCASLGDPCGGGPTLSSSTPDFGIALSKYRCALYTLTFVF